MRKSTKVHKSITINKTLADNIHKIMVKEGRTFSDTLERLAIKGLNNIEAGELL